MGIIFKDKEHELNYCSLLQRMNKVTSNRQAVFYLLALDQICFEHCRELYDFHEDNTIPFNLYNGYFSDGETYIGSDGFEEMLPSRFYTPYTFFGCEDAPYYVEALKIRFPKFWKS